VAASALDADCAAAGADTHSAKLSARMECRHDCTRAV